jgi:cytochrome c-type biogenesis protein CcmE
MKARHKRFTFALIGLVGIGIAATLLTQALRANIAYSFSPSQIAAGEAPMDQLFRIAGMIEENSLTREENDLTVQFVVTDTVKTTQVRYTGILPDLFKEGQGTVAKGRLREDGIFYAEEVLAKHDETYMPPEAADAVKAAQTVVE